MSPRISVVIPIYNAEAYIGECISSLIAQDFEDFEAICVDDGSTDASAAQAREAAAGDPRFCFLAQDNKGQSAARNLGLSHATGEYVLFLDSDDFYTSDALGKLYRKASEESLDELFFSATTFYESRSLRRTNPENNDKRESCEGVLPGPDLFVFFEETGAFRPSACMFMVSRKLLEDNRIGFFEGIIHEDLLFVMQAIVVARRAAFFNESLYRRRMHEGSTMTARRGMKNIDGLFHVGYEMQRWIDAHAADYSPRFVDAYCSRIFYCWDVIAHDATTVGGSELAAYADTLDIPQRILFDLEVREHAKELDRIYMRFYTSKTYRLGDFFMRIPRWAKSRVKLPD